MTYELPARSIRLPGAVQYDCPLSTCGYNFCLPLSDAQLGLTLTMRLWGENSPEMQPGAQRMQTHLKVHTAEEFTGAMAKEEQDFEDAIGEMNEKITNADRDKARAWENAQVVQESLQNVREELADTRLALSETAGLLGRVKGILAEVAGMPADSYEVTANFALVQQLVQPFEPMAPQLPQEGEQGLKRAETLLGRVRGIVDDLISGPLEDVDALAALRNVRALVSGYSSVPPHGDHEYLSTGCRHGNHAYCQDTEGAVGPKVPGQCKFCESPCVCACHRPFVRCSSTTFCAGWGFCHKCAPELAAKAKELYGAQNEISTPAYERAVTQAAQELGVPCPVRPHLGAPVPEEDSDVRP